jgi:hypothetical protein
MGTTPTVGPAASVEPAPAVTFAATPRSNSTEPATTADCRASMKLTAAARRANSAVSTAISVPTAAVKRRSTTVISASAVEPVEPRTRANKGATHKVVRPIVSVRRAIIRGIPVVSVSTCRSRPHVPRPTSEANPHPNLRVGGSRYYHAKPK